MVMRDRTSGECKERQHARWIGGERAGRTGCVVLTKLKITSSSTRKPVAKGSGERR